MKHVVFDIGGVLVNWHPHLAWMDALGSRDAVEAFMDRTAFKERNARADGGEAFTDLARELDDPEDVALFTQYVSRYSLTVPDPIDGTWALIDRLRANGRPVHAITNWSAETWPEGVKAHPRLAKAFDVLVVSGQEGVMKPDPAIFHLLCERAKVAPSDCIFIDDGMHNVEGARAVGMDGVQFTSPDALETDLAARGLL
ncbi:MAG: HAD family phosphatase [Pseudomonadota bacterium]